MEPTLVILVAVLCLAMGLFVGRLSRSGEVDLLKQQLNGKDTTVTQQSQLAGELIGLKDQVQLLQRLAAETSDKRTQAETELTSRLTSMQTLFTGLNAQTEKLASSLSRSQDRGTWGQDTLLAQLLNAGMNEGIHFHQQFKVNKDGGGYVQPDFVIVLPDNEFLVIDSKFPWASYQKAEEAADDAEREKYLAQHAEDLLKHAKSLKTKEYGPAASGPKFVAMYLPFESLWSEALRQKPTLLRECLDIAVVPITPTTTYSLISIAQSLWQQQLLAENAHAVAHAATKFVSRLSAMADKLTKVSDQMNAAANTYNDFVKNFNNSFVRSAKGLADHGVKFEKELKFAGETEASYSSALNQDGVIDIEPVDELPASDD